MREENIALGRQIGHVSHLFRRNIDNLIAEESRDCADGSLTGRNFWVLRYLQDHPGEDVFQKDMDAAFKIRRSTVSRMMELMEQKGMLTRESVNGDARLKRLVLTGKAEALLTAVSNGVERMEDEVRAGFTEKEYATMTSLLGRLTDILENRELTTNERNSGNLL